MCDRCGLGNAYHPSGNAVTDCIQALCEFYIGEKGLQGAFDGYWEQLLILLINFEGMCSKNKKTQAFLRRKIARFEAIAATAIQAKAAIPKKPAGKAKAGKR